MVFCVSLSGCMVYIVISFFVIVLKDRRLSDFWVVREAFFFGEQGDVRFKGCSRGVFAVLRQSYDGAHDDFLDFGVGWERDALCEE